MAEGEAPAASPVTMGQLFGGGQAPQAPAASMQSLYGGSQESDVPVTPLQKSLKELGEMKNGLTIPPISPDSMIGKGMALLYSVGMPIRFRQLQMVRTGALLGIPGMEELAHKMDPDNTFFGDPHPHDITDFMIDKSSKALGVSQAPGFMARSTIGVAKAVAGLTAEIMSDPLMAVQGNTLNSAGKALEMAGRVAEITPEMRNLISVGSEFGITHADLAAAKTAIAESKPGQLAAQGVEKLRSKPFVNQIIKGAQDLAATPGKLIRALSVDTGVPEIDYHTNKHQALSKGKDAGSVTSFVEDFAKRGFTPEEMRVMGELGERMPNPQTPGMGQKMIKAGGMAVNATEGDLRDAAFVELPKVLGRRNITIDPARRQAIIDGAVDLKYRNSKVIEHLIGTGEITEENIAEKVRENHLPHVLNPLYDGNKEAEALAAQLDRPKLSGGKFIRQRTIEGSVAEINELAAAKKKPNLFIDNPVVAVAIRESKALKAVRDSELLEILGKYGKRADKAPPGWMPINHPRFEGKMIVGVGEDGVQFTRRFKDIVFPPEIATKMNYLFAPKSILSMSDFFGGAFNKIEELGQTANQVTRATTFMAPWMWLRNGMANLLKAHAFGVSPESVAETFQGLRNGFKGGKSVNGKVYSGQQIMDMLKDYNAFGGNSFREVGGMEEWLGAAKQSFWERSKQKPGFLGTKVIRNAAEEGMNYVAHYGEKAEGLSRAAFMYHKVMKEGYLPEAAADLMTRVFFDYTRFSPGMNRIRFFAPFAQHPIKSAISLPAIVGAKPSLWNTYHNIVPQVLGNVMSDPVTWHAANQVMPEWLRGKDPMAGQLLGGDSWMLRIFGIKPTAGGKQLYFTPDFGMEVAGNITHFGLSAPAQALMNFVKGENQWGQKIPTHQKWNQLFWDTIDGTLNFPATSKLIRDQTGTNPPEAYEAATTFLMRAVFSQAGGLLDIDKEAHNRILSLSIARSKLQKEGVQQLRSETKGVRAHGYDSYSNYITKRYGTILPATNAEILADTKASNNVDQHEKGLDKQKAMTARDFMDGKLNAGQYISRIKGIDETIKQVNFNYRFILQRYLDMMKGAKSPEEARARIDPNRVTQ